MQHPPGRSGKWCLSPFSHVWIVKTRQIEVSIGCFIALSGRRRAGGRRGLLRLEPHKSAAPRWRRRLRPATSGLASQPTPCPRRPEVSQSHTALSRRACRKTPPRSRFGGPRRKVTSFGLPPRGYQASITPVASRVSVAPVPFDRQREARPPAHRQGTGRADEERGHGDNEISDRVAGGVGRAGRVWRGRQLGIDFQRSFSTSSLPSASTVVALGA